jgi:hypothetical protein
MLEVHGAGDFEGENCMHVLCVQQREAILCAAFEVVARELPRDDVVRLLTAQANGTFFRKPPVDLYGSTPLSYASTPHAVHGSPSARPLVVSTERKTLTDGHVHRV